MAKCISCGKNTGKYFHYDGGKVCDACLGKYFTCSQCGFLFNQDDYVNLDNGGSFCKNCAKKYDK